MSLPKNSQRRLQSSTRIDLARDLHDSLAQDLVAIGFQLDLFISQLPNKYQATGRDIRFGITEATKRVRKELFSLRDKESEYQEQLKKRAGSLSLTLIGDISKLSEPKKRIIDELVRNAASHSKGHLITVGVSEELITVSDDGQGLFGVAETVAQLGGKLKVNSGIHGTQVEISFR